MPAVAEHDELAIILGVNQSRLAPGGDGGLGAAQLGDRGGDVPVSLEPAKAGQQHAYVSPILYCDLQPAGEAQQPARPGGRPRPAFSGQAQEGPHDVVVGIPFEGRGRFLGEVGWQR
jgi:hypothetical protein